MRQLQLLHYQSASVLKVGVVDVCILSHLKEEVAWAIDNWLWVISTIMQTHTHTHTEIRKQQQF